MSPMAKRDYYEVLGVKRSAGEAEIKSAYRKAARRYHPDVNKDPDATARFREATEAYEALSDPQKRKLYDQFGHAGVQGSAAGGPGGPGGSRVYTWTGDAGGVNFEEVFGGAGGFVGMSLDDILQALGGMGGRRSRRAARSRVGADLEYHLTMDFLQAARGTTASVRIQRAKGTETIDVKIPPGVREGSKVRVRGKGQEGPGGPGDLYIITHVHPHPYFRTEGDDVYVDVPISITEAALGAKVDVPTIDGMTTVTIPPGSSSMRRLRLRGQGIPAANGRSRGDQYVVVRIVVPPSLSEKGSRLLKELAEAERFDPRADAPWR